MIFFNSSPPPPPTPQEKEYQEATQDRSYTKRRRLARLGEALKLHKAAGEILRDLTEDIMEDPLEVSEEPQEAEESEEKEPEAA